MKLTINQTPTYTLVSCQNQCLSPSLGGLKNWVVFFFGAIHLAKNNKFIKWVIYKILISNNLKSNWAIHKVNSTWQVGNVTFITKLLEIMEVESAKW